MLNIVVNLLKPGLKVGPGLPGRRPGTDLFAGSIYTGSLVFTALARIITAILQINEGVMGKNEVT